MTAPPEGHASADGPHPSADGVTRAVHYIICGRVQGVGYRYFVAREAHRLQVSGWVRNRPDGTVEVVGAGRPEVLDEFLRLLRQGHQGARVDAVQPQQTVIDMTVLRGDFDIRG